jgi:hypothetical protein
MYTGGVEIIKPLNVELNLICDLLALLGAHHILHVSRIRVKISAFHRIEHTHCYTTDVTLRF